MIDRSINGWVKTYSDGSSYFGDDVAVRAGVASWRNSKLHGMICAELFHDGRYLKITGLCDYWQADKYIYSANSKEPRVIKRTISCLLDYSRGFKFITIVNNDNFSLIANVSKINTGFGQTIIPIKESMGNKWLELSYDVVNKTTSYSINKGR